MRREPLTATAALEVDRRRTGLRVQQPLGHHAIVHADDHQLAMAACHPLRHIGGDRQTPGLTARMRDRERQPHARGAVVDRDLVDHRREAPRRRPKGEPRRAQARSVSAARRPLRRSPAAPRRAPLSRATPRWRRRSRERPASSSRDRGREAPCPVRDSHASAIRRSGPGRRRVR